ncbi:lytic polysaccharide monooxygenase, partial [Patellaria atrata CBS 101060]
AASLLASVAGHGGISKYTINGIEYNGNIPYAPDAGQESIQRRWYPNPIEDFRSPAMTCNRAGDGLAAKNPTTYAHIKAGDTINTACSYFQRTWVHCAGPIMVYMANCNGPCEKFDGKGKVWFKIQQAGLKPDGRLNTCDFAQWEATQRGREQHGVLYKGWPVVIPQNLKPGNYLIRHEILMIELNPVQAYPNCANLEISGTGDSVPPEEYLVEFPGTYSMN